VMPLQSPTRPRTNCAPRLASKKCGGPCGRWLPRSSFGARAKSKDGLFPLCKECRRETRGPRGKEGQQARRLEKEIWVLREAFGEVPSLSDILNRCLEEVRQVGATGAKFDEQVEAASRAVLIHGCRRADEIVDETKLSRWAVDNALRVLLAEKVLETRDAYRHAEEAEEPGRPVTEYHPKDSPRGEDFTHLLRRAVDDDLL
jgi:hypothetical protein